MVYPWSNITAMMLCVSTSCQNTWAKTPPPPPPPPLCHKTAWFSKNMQTANATTSHHTTSKHRVFSTACCPFRGVPHCLVPQPRALSCRTPPPPTRPFSWAPAAASLFLTSLFFVFLSFFSFAETWSLSGNPNPSLLRAQGQAGVAR